MNKDRTFISGKYQQWAASASKERQRSVSCVKSSISATESHALLQNEWLPHYLMALNCSQKRQGIFKLWRVTIVQAVLQYEQRNTLNCVSSA